MIKREACKTTLAGFFFYELVAYLARYITSLMSFTVRGTSGR